jgi:hypothetical protein
MKKVSLEGIVAYAGFAFVMSTFIVQMSLLVSSLFGLSHPLI